MIVGLESLGSPSIGGLAVWGHMSLGHIAGLGGWPWLLQLLHDIGGLVG
jgi:hypothetical protein